MWEVGQNKDGEEREMGTPAGGRHRVKVGKVRPGSYSSGGTIMFIVPWNIGAV